MPLPPSQLNADGSVAFTAANFLCCCSLCPHVKQVGAEVACEQSKITACNLHYLHTNTDITGWCSVVLHSVLVTTVATHVAHLLWHCQAVYIKHLLQPSLASYSVCDPVQIVFGLLLTFSSVLSHPAGRCCYTPQSSYACDHMVCETVQCESAIKKDLIMKKHDLRHSAPTLALGLCTNYANEISHFSAKPLPLYVGLTL